MPTEVIQHSELLNDSTRRNYQLPEKLKKSGKEGKSDLAQMHHGSVQQKRYLHNGGLSARP